VSRALRLLVVAGAVASVAVYAYVALRRMWFPYDLEWIEGGVLQHVERVEDGEALYRAPAVDFTALLYAPLYYYVCAAFGALLDVDLQLLRAVSFAASLATMALAYVLVRRETASRAAGLAAAGLFAACYDLSRGWLDLARVDSLFLLFLMAALLVGRYARTTRGAVAAAVLLVLATYTKQQAAVAMPAIFVFLLLARPARRPAVAFAAVSAIGLAGVYVAAELASDGWFSYYFLELAGQHPWDTEYIRLFFTEDLEQVIPALLVCGLVVWRWWREGERERLLFYVPLGLAIAGGSFLSRVHEGGYPNVVLPTYLFVAVLAAVALGTSFEPRRALAVVVPLALVVQFGLLAYDPGKYIPSDADEARSDRAVAAIRALGGEVYVPSYPVYARRAGLPTYVHTAAAIDVLRADDTGPRAEFEARYEGMIRDACFAHVVATGWPQDHYRRVREILPGERVEAISGLSVPLGQVHVPRGPRRAGADCPG
jgi:4-amino-4-deoxy-L-arabinose transferase-like glycosyltransferase